MPIKPLLIVLAEAGGLILNNQVIAPKTISRGNTMRTI